MRERVGARGQSGHGRSDHNRSPKRSVGIPVGVNGLVYLKERGRGVLQGGGLGKACLELQVLSRGFMI